MFIGKHARELRNPLLRRYWFRTGAERGVGVTAYSREDAETILAESGLLDSRGFASEEITEDVDLQTLEDVCRKYGFGPPNFRGVWFPFVYFLSRDKGAQRVA